MKDLRVAIVHYHLRPGGVTRVIQNAVDALGDKGVRTVVIVGEKPESAVAEGLSVRVIDGLGYAGDGEAPVDLSDELGARSEDALGGRPDLWHVHNHSLAKTRSLPLSVSRLAAAGERLLLQIHDFPEDSRPASYRAIRASLDPLCLYPSGERVRYALLTQRDRELLRGAGLRESQLDLLPNAVRAGDPDGDPGSARDHRLFLYPTRAIRRKNLGEFILWSALAEDGDRFQTTLSPANPVEQPVHERWVSFAKELGLPVDFAVVESGASFDALMHSAHAMVTTSVAEGFGLSFLEPWLFRKPVLGRDLPGVTADFVEEGMDLSGLYERLEVPFEWVGEARLREKIADKMGHSLEAYGREPAGDAVDRAFEAAVRDGRVDFGRLDEELQEGVIRRVHVSADAKRAVRPASLEFGVGDGETLRQNVSRIEARYGVERYGERLLGIYASLLEAGEGPVELFPADRVLDQFLAPEQFCLLRS